MAAGTAAVHRVSGQVAEDNRPKALDLVAQVAEASRAKPDNLSFETYQNTADPIRIVLLKRYASREAFAALGTDGINIEDSTDEHLIDPAAPTAKITAIKRRSPDAFVNARVDTYWLGQHADLPTTLVRARQYVQAGADGIFVPGVTTPHDLAALAEAIPLPLNVLVVPDLPLPDLARCRVPGVRRCPGRCRRRRPR
jgi:Phosphoenolpyruvate phosphomutase/Antibiotic biosynthesis monooxygenase